MGKKSGMTLIEVMAMVAILSFMFLGVSRWFAVSKRIQTRTAMVSKAQDYLDAIEAALRRVDVVYVQSYSPAQKAGDNLPCHSSDCVDQFVSVEYGTYYLPWASSPIRSTLEELEQLGRGMGYTFSIRMWPQLRLRGSAGHFRTYTRSEGRSDQGDLVDWSADVNASMEYFYALYPLRDVDGDRFMFSFFPNPEGRITSEMPDTDIKRVAIAAYPDSALDPHDDRTAGSLERVFFVRRQEFGSDESGVGKDILPLTLSHPTISHLITARRDPEERAAYDLAVPYPCQELPVFRVDRYNDPVLGLGTARITGRTTPGATVSIRVGAYTSVLDSFTAGSDGRFINQPLPGWTTYFDGNMNPAARGGHELAIQATKGPYKSGFTYMSFSHLKPYYTQIKQVHPAPGTVVKTLTPLVGLEVYGWDYHIDPGCSGVWVDGQPKTLTWTRIESNYIGGLGPAPLTDNTSYSILEQLRSKSGYKSSATWSFQVDLGTPGPSEFDDSPPVFTSLSPAPGSTVTGSVKIQASVSDPESGVDTGSVKVLLDGHLLVDVANGLGAESVRRSTATIPTIFVRHSVSSSLPSGSHAVELRARHWSNDPPGSREGSVSWTFTKP